MLVDISTVSKLNYTSRVIAIAAFFFSLSLSFDNASAIDVIRIFILAPDTCGRYPFLYRDG